MRGIQRWPPFLLDGVDTTEMMNAMPRMNPETGEFNADDLERLDETREQALKRSVLREATRRTRDEGPGGEPNARALQRDPAAG
jgi:hypothetical protein